MATLGPMKLLTALPDTRAGKILRILYNKIARHQWLVIFVLGAIHGAALTKNALFDDATLAAEGDGWGAISDIYDISANVHERGLGVLVGDMFQSKTVGLGVVTEGSPMAMVWKVIYWAGGRLFNPTTAYDVIVFLSIVGVWLGVYYLMRRGLGSSGLVALVTCFMFASSDHFNRRVAAHLSFLTIAAPIATLAVAIRFILAPSIRRGLALAVALCLTIGLNEYFGYFCLFVVAGVIVLGAGVGLARQGWEYGKSLVRPLAAGIALLIALLIATYPTLTIGSRLQRSSQQKVATHIGHGSSEIWTYATDQPWVVFRTDHPVIRKNLPAWVAAFVQDPELYGENSNRVGLPVGVGAWAAVLWGLGAGAWAVGRKRLGSFRHRRALFNVGILVVVAWIATSLAHKPTTGSLSVLTLHYANMFRVGTRALLFLQIAATCLWALSLGLWWDFTKRVFASRPLIGLLMGATAIVWLQWSWRDLQGGQWKFRSYESYPKEQSQINETLAGLPDGVVVRMPFNYPFRSPPEFDYHYRMFRMYDGHPIVNGAGQRQYRAALDRAGLAFKINDITDETISTFEQAGVRYITLNPDFHKLHLNLVADARFKVHKNDSQGMVLELVNTKPNFDQTVLRDRIFYRDSAVFDGANIPSQEFRKRLGDRMGPDASASSALLYVKTKPDQEPIFSPLYFYQEPGSYRVTFDMHIAPRAGAESLPGKQLPQIRVANDDCMKAQTVEFKQVADGVSPAFRAVMKMEVGDLCAINVEATAWAVGDYYLDKMAVERLPGI